MSTCTRCRTFTFARSIGRRGGVYLAQMFWILCSCGKFERWRIKQSDSYQGDPEIAGAKDRPPPPDSIIMRFGELQSAFAIVISIQSQGKNRNRTSKISVNGALGRNTIGSDCPTDPPLPPPPNRTWGLLVFKKFSSICAKHQKVLVSYNCEKIPTM